MNKIYSYVVCRYCKQKISSMSRHDYVTCMCGKTFVDGGIDYVRTNAKRIFQCTKEEAFEIRRLYTNSL
jgi:DNA-directed RNA polymerase subunit RPC12/RpoP